MTADLFASIIALRVGSFLKPMSSACHCPAPRSASRFCGALVTGRAQARVSTPFYLDEMTWRFNNRKNPLLFRDTTLKLIH